MTESIPQKLATPRKWLYVAMAGCALVVLTLIVVALVIVDKPRFGGLVGHSFLQVITSGIFAGAGLLLVGTWNLPRRRSWRSLVLFAWAIVALTSPLFGLLFLLPWGVLALTLPLVIFIFVTLFRGGH